MCVSCLHSFNYVFINCLIMIMFPIDSFIHLLMTGILFDCFLYLLNCIMPLWFQVCARTSDGWTDLRRESRGEILE